MILLCICGHAQPRFCLGCDLTDMMKAGEISIAGGCGFNSRWSASWRIGSGICPFPGREDSEYNEHLKEFGIPNEKDAPIRNSSIGFQYWTGSVYEGVYLEAGIICTQDNEVGCRIGAGYCIPICRCLSAIISAGTDILSTQQKGEDTDKGLRIGVYWTIGKESE